MATLKTRDKMILPDGVDEMLRLADCVAISDYRTAFWTVIDLHGGAVEVHWRVEVGGWTSSDFVLAIQELLRRQARSGSKPIIKVTHR